MDWIVSLAMLTGGAFALLAAIGVLRLPDVFTRMQAAAKGGTMGAGLLLLSVVLHFGDFGVGARGLLVLAFLFATAPVAAHLIGRAAYFAGEHPWEETRPDDLYGHYDRVTHALSSDPLPADLAADLQGDRSSLSSEGEHS